MLLEPSLTLVLAVLDAFDQSGANEFHNIEKLASAFVTLFLANDAGLPLIKKMIMREVAYTGNISLLIKSIVIIY